MDRYNDNRTPAKRTGTENENNTPDTEKDTVQTIAPEIAQPNPTGATPSIPAEMPARDTK